MRVRNGVVCICIPGIHRYPIEGSLCPKVAYVTLKPVSERCCVKV